MSEFWNRIKSKWTSLGGLTLGVIQIIAGIKTGNWTLIASGSSTIIGGLAAKDK